MSVDQLRVGVRVMAQRAQDRAFNWLLNNDPSPDDVAEMLSTLTGVYAESAALLAADWYEDQFPESSYTAFLDDDMAEVKLASMAKWIFDGPQTPESRIGLGAHRLVFDAARRTVFANAATEGVAIARHEMARCCNKCVARATVSAKDRNSSSEDVDQFFHPSCEGVFVPIRNGLYAPPEHTKEWRSRIALARRAGNIDAERIALWLDSH